MKYFSFTTSDVQNLLANKYVVFMGGSVVRTMYKDVVLMLQNNRMLIHKERVTKGEAAFLGDTLVERSELVNGPSYREAREYKKNYTLIKFFFITRVFNPYVEKVVKEFGTGRQPDVIVMNSCIWDISRYGVQSAEQYKKNLPQLFDLIKSIVPSTSLVIWTTAPPVADTILGGVMVNPVNVITDEFRETLQEANLHSCSVARSRDFDILDFYYYMRGSIEMRERDGLHWNEKAHRRFTCLIFRHFCLSWEIELPSLKPVDGTVQESIDTSVKVDEKSWKWTGTWIEDVQEINRKRRWSIGARTDNTAATQSTSHQRRWSIGPVLFDDGSYDGWQASVSAWLDTTCIAPFEHAKQIDFTADNDYVDAVDFTANDDGSFDTFDHSESRQSSFNHTRADSDHSFGDRSFDTWDECNDRQMSYNDDVDFAVNDLDWNYFGDESFSNVDRVSHSTEARRHRSFGDDKSNTSHSGPWKSNLSRWEAAMNSDGRGCPPKGQHRRPTQGLLQQQYLQLQQSLQIQQRMLPSRPEARILPILNHPVVQQWQPQMQQLPAYKQAQLQAQEQLRYRQQLLAVQRNIVLVQQFEQMGSACVVGSQSYPEVSPMQSVKKWSPFKKPFGYDTGRKHALVKRLGNARYNPYSNRGGRN